MDRSRRSTIALLLLYSLAVAIPPGAQAAEPHGGTLGAGLAAVAAGDAPDRSIVSRVSGGARELAVSVELTEDPGNAVRARLRSAGLDPGSTWRRTIEGYVRPERLRGLAATPGVHAVRAIRLPIADAFIGQAPGLVGAMPWHQAQYSGKGVKVGILDTSFEGMVARLGTELPSIIQVRCFAQVGVASSNPADCVTPGETHGTAVAESIVDMAPGASLYVSNAYSPADMAAAVRWMTGEGVRVINFSRVSPILMEGLGDGLSEYSDSTYTIVDAAVAGGALFVAAAGNEGETSWTGPATDADGNGWVEFSTGDEANSLDLRAGDEILAAIRWAGAASDYDLSIWRDDTKLDESAGFDPGGTIEVIDFTAPSAGRYEISIRHAAGPAVPSMRLMVHTAADTALTYRTPTGSLPTPADSRNAGMVTVGAVGYSTPSVIEPYSSRGPTLDGRIKPDLVAVDCVDTTVAAGFCGTSQAAPFVTGAAALLLEADPALTPTALASLLKGRVMSLGTPAPNNTFGYGLLSLGPVPTTAPAAASFVAPPASGTVGGPLLGQPTVGVIDAGGGVTKVGPGATMSVTLSLVSNPAGATLACDGGNTRAAVAGIAAFTGCALDQPGTGYTMRADIAGLVAATSAPFSVLPVGGTPRVGIAVAPTTVTLGKAVAGSVLVPAPGAPPASAALESSVDARVWSTVRDVPLDPVGTGPFTATPTVNRWLRARIVNADGSTDVSAGVYVRVNATAVLASSIPSGRTVGRTTKITFTETIRPVGADVARGRARFDFFLKVGASWVRKRTSYANADPATGRARLVTTLPAYGSWWIRSRAEPTTTNGASAWTPGFRYVVR